MKRSYTGLIKKYGDHYVAFCPELNVASQGESLEEARKMLQDACLEYLTYIKEEGHESEIRQASIDTLREFFTEEVEVVKVSSDWSYSESISFNERIKIKNNKF